jgi:hypothetical protein
MWGRTEPRLWAGLRRSSPRNGQGRVTAEDELRPSVKKAQTLKLNQQGSGAGSIQERCRRSTLAVACGITAAARPTSAPVDRSSCRGARAAVRAARHAAAVAASSVRLIDAFELS